MTVLRPHEAQVVRLLASSQLPSEILEDVIATASFVRLSETGWGYFLEVEHPQLPKKRVVCSKPLLLGRAGDLTCGFVLFLEDCHLTLECHGWVDAIPAGFRARDITVGIAP